ncbi:MAG: anthranilate phosphoribosyltransferase, partial [Phycisphaeraceae bacterium]|nr:anthranilate phosphoribosyltransferase [Phycisphaeraceae bacterium]
GREKGPALDMMLLNAASAIVAADVASSFEEGIERARVIIESGSAAATLTALVAASRG